MCIAGPNRWVGYATDCTEESHVYIQVDQVEQQWLQL
jgi:hypothetical protein